MRILINSKAYGMETCLMIYTDARHTMKRQLNRNCCVGFASWVNCAWSGVQKYVYKTQWRFFDKIFICYQHHCESILSTTPSAFRPTLNSFRANN